MSTASVNLAAIIPEGCMCDLGPQNRRLLCPHAEHVYSQETSHSGKQKLQPGGEQHALL